MYKSKLQELCQQRSWELPTYESSRQGQAHNPRFLATVTVNDISFHSPSPSNTSKKAQNDAAKLAFEHFSNSRRSPSLSGSFSERAGAITCLPPGGTLQLNAQNANQTSQINEAVAVAKTGESFGGSLSERTGVITCLPPGGALQLNTQNANQTSQVNEAVAVAKTGESFGVAAGSFSERAVAISCLSPGGTLQLNTQNANQTSQINEVVAVAKSGESFGGSLSVSTEVNSHLSLRGSTQLNTQNANQTPQLNEATTVARNDDRSGDMQHLFKSQLQTYAQKRNFALPVYSCERVGPSHASRFTCKVTVNGHTFESLESFPTLNKAEHAAAKAALMSLLPNGVDEDGFGYKNLLQELAQREGCGLPTYSTNKSGEAHIPTFTSTVEIEGEIFTGQGAKTKKQAEMSAAKTAYTALKQRNSNQSPAFLSPACQFQEAPQSSTLLAPAFQAHEAVQSTTCLSPAHQGHNAQQFSTPSLLADLTAFLQKNIQPKLPVPCEQDEKDRGKYSGSSVTNIASSSGAAISSSTKHDQASSSLPPDSSPRSAASSSIEHLVGRGTSSHSRNIIHPRGTAVTYPPGTTVLPISDDNWVAVKIPPQPSQ
ncbi:double-stranded RNA-binding protein [Salix suchowensis]|nr:double-stranded RNA-binding protein [Salix suchowensis]